MKKIILFALTLCWAWSTLPSALAAGAASSATPLDNEKRQVETIKEKYWARGDESELGVVQNRLYTKAGKVEVGFFGGLVSTDPFLDVQTIGASAGWHLSEYFALHALGWKSYASPSSALRVFEAERKATTNTNMPKSFLGLELAGSFLYGKLSLFGKKIIYYDLYVNGGAGLTETESGRYFTPIVGLGQQFYVTKMISLKINYRLTPYHENIIEKVIPTSMGTVIDERTNWSHTFALGVSFLLGGGAEE